MDRRGFFQACAALALAPQVEGKTVEQLCSELSEPKIDFPDWPEGNGGVEYDYWSPLITRGML